MLEDLSKALADVALAGIGLTVIAVEKTGEIVKVCAERGGDFLEKSRAVGEEWKEKAEQKATECRERCEQDRLDRMTAEEREALRKKLADLDEREAEAARIAAEEAAKAESESKVIDFNADKGDSHDGE